MKKIIGIILSLVFIIEITLSTNLSFPNKQPNEGFILSMLHSTNCALAEGDVAKVKLKVTHEEEVTLPDGTKVTATIIDCIGEGDIECKA